MYAGRFFTRGHAQTADSGNHCTAPRAIPENAPIIEEITYKGIVNQGFSSAKGIAPSEIPMKARNIDVFPAS